MFDEMVAGGLMPKPITMRRRRVWDLRALDAAIDKLGTVEENRGDEGQKNEWDQLLQ
jgi:hypothetical protein